MLNNLFKRLTFVRMEQGAYDRHIATIRGEAKVIADMRIEAAVKERNTAIDQYANAVNRELKATELLQRALILLNEVDPSRSGGKQLRTLREALFADAMLAGLWGEVK